MMQWLDLTLDSPAENLALDEALLDVAEESGEPTECLRIWESREPAVVIGRSSKVDVETRRDECARRGVPILRRSSGGAAVVIGPGCLMYAVVLSYQRRPELALLEEAHRFILGRVAAGVRRVVPGVELQGTSDLAWQGRKFSGNSLRCKRSHLLYHGTILYDFPVELVEQLLGVPPRQPAYRRGRSHDQFVVNLPATAETLRQEIVAAWDAPPARVAWPRQRVQQLVAERYSQASWNERL